MKALSQSSVSRVPCTSTLVNLLTFCDGTLTKGFIPKSRHASPSSACVVPQVPPCWGLPKTVEASLPFSFSGNKVERCPPSLTQHGHGGAPDKALQASSAYPFTPSTDPS